LEKPFGICLEENVTEEDLDIFNETKQQLKAINLYIDDKNIMQSSGPLRHIELFMDNN
jgi:hypothetical protein